MSMPRGKKFDNGYCSIASIPNAKNYKQISAACKQKGLKVGPSNARNILLSAMKKIAKPICEENEVEISDAAIMVIAKNPIFQMSVADIVKEIE
jgi:hypothetical protein